MNPIIIAIDGYSSTGKSTLAKLLAKHFGYVFVDTGAMYRAITWYAIQNGFISKGHFDKDALLKELSNIKLHFVFNTTLGHAEMYLNNTNVENEIRTMQVSDFVSKIAEISEIRAKLVEQQQEMGKNKGIVMDGRDIGTVVFPAAELKIFMNARTEVKAQRRYKELIDKGIIVTLQEIIKNVEERDQIDTQREDSPLIKAADAIEIDNSEMTIEEQLDYILQLIEERF